MPRLVLVVTLFFTFSPGLDSQIDPRGMYFMQNTQGGVPTSFTEWFTVVSLPGPNQYALRDFFGYGWNGTITPDGSITIDGGYPGSFSTPDDFSTQVGAGPGYLYECNRCVDTTVGFPVLFPGTPVLGDTTLDGEFDTVVEVINPATGVVTNTISRVVTAQVTGTELRLTQDNGKFYEGLFDDDSHVSIRVIENAVTGWLPTYASYAQTTTNLTLDVVGEVTFDGPNNFTAILCRQTRDSIGFQSQSLHRLSGTRIIEGGGQVPGDFDQSGTFDLGDPIGLLGHLFSTTTSDLPCDTSSVQDGGNQLVLDASGDGAVDIADVIHMLTYLFLGGSPHVLGTECLMVIDCPEVCP